MFAVEIARRSSEVCTTSGSRPASAINSPPRWASASPVVDNGTSTQPVKRFFSFQSLCPWRKSSRVAMARACQRLHTVSRALLVNGSAFSPVG